MIIDAVQQHPINSSDVAFGIVRIVFAGFTGVCSFILVTLCGVGVYEYTPRKKMIRGPWDRH